MPQGLRSALLKIPSKALSGFSRHLRVHPCMPQSWETLHFVSNKAGGSSRGQPSEPSDLTQV